MSDPLDPPSQVRSSGMPTYLLGAGASKDAGLPLASEITSIAIAKLNSDPRKRSMAALLNYVVSAMLAQAGRAGARPDVYPDIESVVSAIELLSQRNELELTPFIQSWDSGVGLVVPDFHNGTRQALANLQVALSKPHFGEQKFVAAFDAMLDRRLGSNNTYQYRLLNDELVRLLIPTLNIESDASVNYLRPLVKLASEYHDITIGTLNYDLAIETAASANGVEMSLGVENWSRTGTLDPIARGLTLLKLHGSIGWTASAAPAQTPLSLRPDPFSPKAPTEHGEQPAVVYGRREKLRADGPFGDLRLAFAQRLAATQCLVCIGYSFGDEHVNALIRRWINSDPIRWIVIVDPQPPELVNGWYDPSFLGELRGLVPNIVHYRADPTIRPRVYPIAATAAEAIPRICQPADDLRATFGSWESQIRANAEPPSIPKAQE